MQSEKKSKYRRAFYSEAKIQSLSQHQEAIGTLLNRSNPSLMILSASNCSPIGLLKNSKYPNAVKESNPRIPIRDIFGLLGAILYLVYQNFLHLTIY